MNLIYIKNYLKSLFNLKINIILIIFYLPELSIEYNINVEAGDISDVFELK